MKEEKTYIVPKDIETGELLPRAAIWSNDEYGKMSAEDFMKSKNSKGCEIVVVKLVEVEMNK